MIVLGHSEPNRGAPREVRREDISVSHLVEGVTPENPNLVIVVPSASVMLTIQNSTTMPHRATIYYECDPTSPPTKVELVAVSNEQIEPGFRFIGMLNYRADFVAVYAKAVIS